MNDDTTKAPVRIATEDVSTSRRKVLKASAAVLAGTTPFFGPWAHNRVWAQAAQPKPLVIGLTMDASGQYAASGGEERLGAMMAIKEFNDKGGVLGRRIEALHMDTETTPATGSRVAERMITRNEASFLIGAVHSGVANAISQVAQKYGRFSSTPTRARRPNRARTAIASSSCGTATAATSRRRSSRTRSAPAARTG